MPTKHHLPPEWLMDYAAGALSEAGSVMVASHLSLCPACRCALGQMEAAGGALLDSAEPVPVSESCHQKMMAMIEAEKAPCPAVPASPSSLCRTLPAPIRAVAGCGAGELRFEKATAGIERVILPTKDTATLQIVRMKAGSTLPRHSHDGHEITLVLGGTLRDDGQLYRRGDVMACEAGLVHSPVVGEAEDCLCLVLTDAPIRLTGFWERVLGRLRGEY